MNFEFTDIPTKQIEPGRANQERLIRRELKWRIIENSIIVPYNTTVENDFIGEVVNSDGRIVIGVNSNVNYDSCTSRLFNKNHEIEGEEIIYLGALIDCYGHYITDNISKLWILQTDEYKELIRKHVKISFVPRYKIMDKCPPLLYEIYKLLGLKEEVIPVDRITRFKKIYIPDNSIFIEKNSRHYTIEYRKLIDNLIQSVPAAKSDKYEKIYLSRTRLLNKNTEFGEREIERLFKSLGYKILYPEQMTFTEQISVYQKAKSLVTTEGSIGHNAVFCNELTDVVIIRKAFYTNDYQYMINKVKNLKTTYIDAHLSVFVNSMPNLGPFFMYINSNLINFIYTRYNKKIRNSFSKRKFGEYALICLMKSDFEERHQCPSYYFQKLRNELLQKKSLLKVLYRRFLSMIMYKRLSDSVKRIVLMINR